MTVQTLDARQAEALAAGPFRGMDEESARRLNNALIGALVRVETIDSGETEGTFMGVSFGNERCPMANWNGDIVIMQEPGSYLVTNCATMLKFEVLQAVRYTCAFCGKWDSPHKLHQDTPNRMVHKRDCLSLR